MSRSTPITRTALTAAAALAALALAACSAVVTDRSGSEAAGSVEPKPETTAAAFDLTTANLETRPHIDPIPEAVAALEASGFEPIQEGRLTIALGGAGAPPTSFFAEDDAQTIIGSDPDFGSLIAEGLGLEYAPENVAWADWPLGVESGKYDLALTNIGVTEERKDLFDFATYRDAVMGFIVADGSDVQEISKPEDVSGLRVVVGSGTNQEKFLLDWNWSWAAAPTRRSSCSTGSRRTRRRGSLRVRPSTTTTTPRACSRSRPAGSTRASSPTRPPSSRRPRSARPAWSASSTVRSRSPGRSAPPRPRAAASPSRWPS
jgi:ABC-type amino acid transport substrate-binding protein